MYVRNYILIKKVGSKLTERRKTKRKGIDGHGLLKNLLFHAFSYECALAFRVAFSNASNTFDGHQAE